MDLESFLARRCEGSLFCKSLPLGPFVNSSQVSVPETFPFGIVVEDHFFFNCHTCNLFHGPLVHDLCLSPSMAIASYRPRGTLCQSPTLLLANTIRRRHQTNIVKGAGNNENLFTFTNSLAAHWNNLIDTFTL